MLPSDAKRALFSGMSSAGRALAWGTRLGVDMRYVKLQQGTRKRQRVWELAPSPEVVVIRAFCRADATEYSDLVVIRPSGLRLATTSGGHAPARPTLTRDDDNFGGSAQGRRSSEERLIPLMR